MLARIAISRSGLNKLVAESLSRRKSPGWLSLPTYWHLPRYRSIGIVLRKTWVNTPWEKIVRKPTGRSPGGD
jgi:hypothetical protein